MTTPPGDAAGILSEVSAGDRAAMRQGDVAAWSREGWEVSREFAYGTVLADPCAAVPAERPVITEAITRRLIPIVRRQAARGGIRLARILDAVLDPARAADNPIAARR